MYSRAPVPVKSGGPIECIDERIAGWVGSAAVAEALHVISIPHWAVCGSNASFSFSRTEKDERYDVYPDIWKAGVRVLIYNGEADACVPWIDNEWWVRSMNFSVAKPWTAWESNSQVAGYITQYQTPAGKEFNFATVKGAGHSEFFFAAPAQRALAPSPNRNPPPALRAVVPEVRPEQAWTLFNAFVNGQALA